MDKTGDFSEEIQSTSARPPYSTTEKGRQDVNSLKCCECDGKIIKESNKSKSRVWRKVMWFTRRSKIGKQSVCQCDDLGTDFQRDLTRASERHSNSWSFTRSASRKFRISSRKRQRKSDIAKKPCHSHARSVHGSCIKENSETYNNYRADSPTATGSFCDFGSSCHVGSRAARNTKRASVLTGIARELNPPVVPPLRDLRHQPLDPASKSLSSSSVSYAPHSSVRQSPLSVKGVRRWNSFSGPFTNVSSFKRRNSGPRYKTGGVSSPPLKQKCYGLRRTATFSGKLNTEFINTQVRKSKSANTADFIKLEKASSSMGEIRDQDGSIIGIVHFYKSPKSTCIRRLSSFNHGVKTAITSSPEEVHVPTNVPKNQGSTSSIEIINFNERPNEKTPFPSDCSSLQKSICEDQTSSQETTSNACQSEEAVFVNSFNSPDIPTSFSHLQDLQTSIDTGVINNDSSTSFPETGMDLSPILCSPDSPSLSSTMVDDEGESCSIILPGSVSVDDSSLLTEEICVPQCDETVLENSELIGAEMKGQTVDDCLSDFPLSDKDEIFESICENPSPSATVQGTGSAIEGVLCDQDEILTGVHTNPDISLTMQESINNPSMNDVPDRVQMLEHTIEDQLFSEIQEDSNNVCTNPMFEEQQLLDNKSDQGVHISVYNENTNLDFQKDSSSNSLGITNSSSNILNRNYLDDNPMEDSEQPEIQHCLPSITDKTVDTLVVGTPDICGASSLEAVEGICDFGINENNSLERFLDDKIPLTDTATQSKQTDNFSKPCSDLKNAFACDESMQNLIANETQINDTCTPLGKEYDPSLPHVCKYSPDERDGSKACFSESSEKVRRVWKQGVPQEDVKQSAPVLASNHDGKLGKNSIQVLDTSNTSDYASCSDEDLSNQSVPISPWKTSKQKELMSDELGLPVPGQVFKMRTELMMSWFDEFNDEQKNIVMKKLLNRCELPQMHLLSVAMENNLHKSCPPNCQDMLVWLPYPVTLKILMYLDSVSLCRCNQVNKAWRKFTNNPLLWQQLTRSPDYQLSEASSRIQYLKYTLPNGKIHWKKVLAERFLLQRNWLNGKYKLRTYQGHNQGIACVQFDDTRIVSGSSDKTIKLWDISSTTCELMLTLEGHSGTVRCLDLNGNRLVSGSTDRTIKVWDLSFASYWAGASCKVTMVGHLHTVRCLQADDKKLVSGSYDKTVKVWDLKTGQCQLTLRGHTAAVLCVQFDDQKIVSGSYDKKIKVWDLTEGTCLMTLDGHQDAVTCLNLTHDGMKIITGSLDYSLKFWDLFTGKCYGTLDWITSEGHTAVVRCLQVDSWRIISGGDDKTLKVWELATGQRLLTLRCHSDGVTCMQFNDFAIVSGSYDRTVKLWDFTPKHPYLEASN